MVPENPEPMFGNDTEAVPKEAAELVAKAFRSLIGRGEDRARAQRFVLQAVVSFRPARWLHCTSGALPTSSFLARLLFSGRLVLPPMPSYFQFNT